MYKTMLGAALILVVSAITRWIVFDSPAQATIEPLGDFYWPVFLGFILTGTMLMYLLGTILISANGQSPTLHWWASKMFFWLSWVVGVLAIVNFLLLRAT